MGITWIPATASTVVVLGIAGVPATGATGAIRGMARLPATASTEAIWGMAGVLSHGEEARFLDSLIWAARGHILSRKKLSCSYAYPVLLNQG